MILVGSPPDFFLSCQDVNFQHTSNFQSPFSFPGENPLPPSCYKFTLTCQGLKELVTATLAPDQQIVGGFWVLKLHSQALVAKSHFQMGNIRQVVRVILLQPVCRLSPNHRAQPSAAAGCPISFPTTDCSRGLYQKSLCMSPHLSGKADRGGYYPTLTALLQGLTRHHSPHLITPVTSST